MEIKFSASAVRDLIRLRKFIAVNNPLAAERMSLRLQQAIGKLALFPDIGVRVEEPEGVRELVAGNYVVRYSRSDEEIFILRIWHGKEYRDSD
ncbi:plasmid stabilization protein [Dulcicalothrix desertica PCC 7102]|uniref:Plasmid stabilization protein n=1 Tax=Dulcicalothrix desertica PCC 7102 TaxID=232991 RepID=A0A3S1CPY1_9CYAN|nr:type II toxin-antitoxin system RelE/ParE family toxin [Dulcicalothrix desertica]RUT06167.1 plasmid stabilization protein [Dulcicalothrix desertica PCC 7102]TWH54174.1 plasmid stabilization system protein ParE [Dulcicalothrix desertica PCC 7102]